MVLAIVARLHTKLQHQQVSAAYQPGQGALGRQRQRRQRSRSRHQAIIAAATPGSSAAATEPAAGKVCAAVAPLSSAAAVPPH